jgi:hypothetical protein
LFHPLSLEEYRSKDNTLWTRKDLVNKGSNVEKMGGIQKKDSKSYTVVLRKKKEEKNKAVKIICHSTCKK